MQFCKPPENNCHLVCNVTYTKRNNISNKINMIVHFPIMHFAVPHFAVPHFPALIFCPAFSDPAFSAPHIHTQKWGFGRLTP